MKKIILRILSSIFTIFTLTMAAPVMAFTVCTSPSNLTGLWNNPDEPGWGVAITHQFGTIFATLFTYDIAGNPTWYAASNCAVSGSGCSGALYSVTGGSSPTAAWNAPNKIVTQVGTLTLSFTDADTGTMSYTINGSNGMKAIARFVFATAPATPPVTATCTSSNFTLAKYSAITIGMTLDQVNQAIGCVNNTDPIVRTANSIAYQWGGLQTGTIGYIVVYFDLTNSTVISKGSGGF